MECIPNFCEYLSVSDGVIEKMVSGTRHIRQQGRMLCDFETDWLEPEELNLHKHLSVSNKILPQETSPD